MQPTALLTPEILCKNHNALRKQLMTDCANCAALNTTLDEAAHQKRYEELWDKVTAVKNEDGSSKVVVTVPLEEPLEAIGSLKNMNMPEAEKMTKKIMTKAAKLKSLEIIHGQIRDKISAGHLSIIPPETDILRITKEGFTG